MLRIQLTFDILPELLKQQAIGKLFHSVFSQARWFPPTEAPLPSRIVDIHSNSFKVRHQFRLSQRCYKNMASEKEQINDF